MRAEVERLVQEIKQSVGLLRRPLLRREIHGASGRAKQARGRSQSLERSPEGAEIMQERTSLEDALNGIGKVERELEDDIGMIELGEAENDQWVVDEAEAALTKLTNEVA